MGDTVSKIIPSCDYVTWVNRDTRETPGLAFSQMLVPPLTHSKDHTPSHTLGDYGVMEGLTFQKMGNVFEHGWADRSLIRPTDPSIANNFDYVRNIQKVKSFQENELTTELYSYPPGRVYGFHLSNCRQYQVECANLLDTLQAHEQAREALQKPKIMIIVALHAGRGWVVVRDKKGTEEAAGSFKVLTSQDKVEVEAGDQATITHYEGDIIPFVTLDHL